MGQLLERRARYRDVCRLKAEIHLKNGENIIENNKKWRRIVCILLTSHYICGE